MPQFLTDTIIQAFNDVESTKYRIQAQLQKKRQAFDKKILYPHMVDLIETRHDLLTINKKKEHILEKLKQSADITMIDILDFVIERKNETGELRENICDVLELADWAFPLVNEILNVGRKLYADTLSGIEIDWVSLVSVYIEEGYIIVVADTDAEGEDLQVFSFQRQRYIADSKDLIYVLKTKRESVDSKATEPNELKRDLLSSRTDKQRASNPNPAIIRIDTSVLYPFTETVFPVAKRLLLRWLIRQEKNRDIII